MTTIAIIAVLIAAVGTVILYNLLFKISLQEIPNTDSYPELTELTDGVLVMFLEAQEYGDFIILSLIVTMGSDARWYKTYKKNVIHLGNLQRGGQRRIHIKPADGYEQRDDPRHTHSVIFACP